DEVADFNDNVMRVGLAGGTLSYRNHELTLQRHGKPEKVWMNLDYSPVPGEDGKPAGVIAVVVEVTEAVANRRTLEQSEARLRFLDELSQAVAESRDASEVLAITTRLTGEHLTLSNCAYADVDSDEDGFTVRGDWHATDASSVVGRYRLSDFGERAFDTLRAGRPVIINDLPVDAEPRQARRGEKLGVRAAVCAPLIKDGRLTGLMTMLDSAPRTWSESELNVIREVADRSWAHIQRVGAEGALRESETYNRQILDSASDYGIVAMDMNGLVTLWNRGAAKMLGWTEREMIGKPISVFFTPEDRAAGRPEIKRKEALSSGRAQDARWHVRKSGERFWGLSEMTPLHDERGRLIGFVKLMRDRTVEYAAQEALKMS
ncbi:MAG: PAS domain S-box protein, partial [Sphingomonadales bacterium]